MPPPPLPSSLPAGRDRPRAFFLGLLVLVAAASFLPPHLAILLRGARGRSPRSVRGAGEGDARAGGAWAERVDGGGLELPGPLFFAAREEGGFRTAHVAGRFGVSACQGWRQSMEVFSAK